MSKVVLFEFLRRSGKLLSVYLQIFLDGESSAEEKREALQMLEDTVAVMRRVFGPAHPDTLFTQRKLKIYRRKFPGPGPTA